MLVFHHIPKTAGSAFVALLQRNLSEQELFRSYADKPDPASWWRDWYRSLKPKERDEIKCVASHSAQHLIPVLRKEGVPFEVVTLLRDPVDRCTSLYHYVLELAQRGEQQAGGQAGQILLENRWSLEDIFLHADEIVSTERYGVLSGFFNGQARAILRPLNKKPRFGREPVQPQEKADLNEALEHYDVGTVEDYRRTIDRWGARFDWRQRNYEAVNVTESRRNAPALSPEASELVRSYNQADAELHRSFRQVEKTG